MDDLGLRRLFALVEECHCTKYTNCMYYNNIDFDNWSNEELTNYYVHINDIIRGSGCYNFEFCKFPVPMPWNVEKFNTLLNQAGYRDMGIIKFLKYGWPVEVHNLARVDNIPPNQKGARDNPGDLKDYIIKEKAANAIIGGTDSLTVSGSMYLSY